MNKYIHYCWFGESTLPKLAKECIKSWKKYFPDYEIIEWNETNFDVNLTNFSKRAYEEKKWAFVSDVARVYALKKYGGIYLDTDMKIISQVGFLNNRTGFIGWEDQNYLAVGVMGFNNKNHTILNELFSYYENTDFIIEDIDSYAMPKLITNICKKIYGNIYSCDCIKEFDDGFTLYPIEYFYPYNFNYERKLFTENTCMIHYYDASWATSNIKKSTYFHRKLGSNAAYLLSDWITINKKVIKYVTKWFVFKLFKSKVNKRNQFVINNLIDEIMSGVQINDIHNNYIAFYNKKWMGTSNATLDTFKNTMDLNELFDKTLIHELALNISYKFDLIIFSAFACGWKDLIIELKKINQNQHIKVLWHGSQSMNVEDYDRIRLNEVTYLHNCNQVDSIGFLKKSMYEFYKEIGFRVEYLQNIVRVDKNRNKDYNLKKTIGIYASGDRWVKNLYSQLCAASLFENYKVDIVPLSDKILEFSESLNINVTGTKKILTRNELSDRMLRNEINIYVTFTECAPLIPLESLELGVPCVTSNNHDYFQDSELSTYLIIDKPDNVMEIYDKIKMCIENRDKIIELYNEWSDGYKKEALELMNRFISVGE